MAYGTECSGTKNSFESPQVRYSLKAIVSEELIATAEGGYGVGASERTDSFAALDVLRLHISRKIVLYFLPTTEREAELHGAY